jgi:predicted GNAT family N-acyltransferase
MLSLAEIRPPKPLSRPLPRRKIVRIRNPLSITVRTIQSVNDLNEVLNLRNRAYLEAGKRPPRTSMAEIQNSHDTQTLGFYLSKRLVASISIRYPSKTTKLESIDIPLKRYPKVLPQKTDSIEISKFCISKDLRGSAVTKKVFETVHELLVKSGRSSILIASDPKLVAKYEFIGFKRTGVRYPKPGNPEVTLEVMTTTQKRFGIYGFHVGPIKWNLFLGEATEKLLKSGSFKRPGLQKLLFWTYRPFRTLTESL